MKNCIPGDLWNQIIVPTIDTESTNVKTYLSEMAYRLASITDVMMGKELWHTICELSDRCGALRERVVKTIKKGSSSIIVNQAEYGEFQRFIGAGINGVPVGMDSLNVEGNEMTFAGIEDECDAYVDVSVVPDLYANPENQNAPLWFFRKYERALMSGTLMRIYAMTGEKWSDATLARMNATTYLKELNRMTHGLITSGMRKQTLFDAEGVLARQSQTTSSTTTSNTVG